MLEILHTVLNVGLEKPVKLLHVTDVHICEVSELDEPWQQELMKERIGVFQREGKFPKKHPKNSLKSLFPWQKSLAQPLL